MNKVNDKPMGSTLLKYALTSPDNATKNFTASEHTMLEFTSSQKKTQSSSLGLMPNPMSELLSHLSRSIHFIAASLVNKKQDVDVESVPIFKGDQDALLNENGSVYADSLRHLTTSNMTAKVPVNTLALASQIDFGNTMPISVGNGGVIDQSDFELALKKAALEGRKLNVNGEVIIKTPITIQPQSSFAVDATKATFIAQSGLDGDEIANGKFGPGDMIRIEAASPAKASDNIRVEWTGGLFDMSGADNAAKASPLINEVNRLFPETAQRRGNASTVDGLSIIGVDKQTGEQLIDSAMVDGIRVLGLPVKDRNAKFDELTPVLENGSDNIRDNWKKAGGDSGLFIQGLSEATVLNSEFYGTRDAGVYLTANEKKGANESYGSGYTVVNNKFKQSFDGVSSKRGADDVYIANNTFEDVVIGISTKKALNTPDLDNLTAKGITIKDNIIDKAARGILLEVAAGVNIDGNEIRNLGTPIADDAPAKNSTQKSAYEGIVFEGVKPYEESKTFESVRRDENGLPIYEDGVVLTYNPVLKHGLFNNIVTATDVDSALNRLIRYNELFATDQSRIILIGFSERDYREKDEVVVAGEVIKKYQGSDEYLGNNFTDLNKVVAVDIHTTLDMTGKTTQ